MHNRNVRSKESLCALGACIAQCWGLRDVTLREAERGFYGETWVVESAEGRFFAKLDCSPHQGIYRHNLLVLQGLVDQNVPHVAPVRKAVGGALFAMFAGGTLALFDFIEGIHTEDYPLVRLFSALTRIYHASPPDGIERETFSGAVLGHIHDHIDALGHDESDERIREILRGHAPTLERYAQKLRTLSVLCMKDLFGFVVTHGDAGGNAIMTDEHFTLIDWDHPMYAPPERDAWFFVVDPYFTAFDRCLAAEGHAYKLQARRIGYYAYYTYFYYLLEYLICYASLSDEAAKRDCADAIAAYFDSWIVNQMRVIESDAAIQSLIERGVKKGCCGSDSVRV